MSSLPHLVLNFNFISLHSLTTLSSLFPPSPLPHLLIPDNRDRASALLSKGYPFEQHPIITQDGHTLSLERLARPGSRHVYDINRIVFEGFTGDFVIICCVYL